MNSMQKIVESRSCETAGHTVLHENCTVFESVQRRTLLKKPNKANLLLLLQIVSPHITLQQLQNDEQRIKTMKQLLVQIHPSNFPSNEDALNIYEDIQTFYDACCENMKINDSKKFRRRKISPRESPTSVVDSVVQFHVRQKWPWLDGYLRPLCPDKLTSGKVLAPLVAYQCINCRGAIAHGKRPSLIYSWDNVVSMVNHSIMDVLEMHGGYKTIVDRKVEDIKVEIIKNGPVISFSFIPTTSFARDHSESIVKSRIKKHHYCMIIGWKLTEYGEVWLVQSYNGCEILHVPVGHSDIEEIIIFPKNNFLSVTWQQGPYYDIDMSNFRAWHQYEELSLILKSHELEELAEVFGERPFHEVISERIRFVIRDKKKNAHSRSCFIDRLKWDRHSKVWHVVMKFIDRGSNPLLDEDMD
mmetsp:Transcript_235/g.378  ORF Transcript_235/g.378 Transcript_235/m.378 type:complete len:414 (+) Transcript_235:54-1295(+)